MIINDYGIKINATIVHSLIFFGLSLTNFFENISNDKHFDFNF